MPGQRAIKKRSLPDTITNDLRERILNGELAEGEVIRQEALAEEYDVSRIPIREALTRLDAEGLVKLTTNRGASVTKHSLREIGEIFDLRTLIEVDLFRQAIPVMNAEDLAKCDAILVEMETSFDADDVAKWGALNHEYHTALYAAADRALTIDLLAGINRLSDRYVRINLSVMKQLELAKREHRDLLEMAQKRDVEAGCAALRNHLGRTKEQLLEMVAENRRSQVTK